MRLKALADKTLDALYEAFPDASCSLDKDFPERLAVRGILSAQCTDTRVNLTAHELFEIYPAMEDIDRASNEKIESVIRPCGLYKAKARSIKAFAKLYLTDWEKRIPKDTDELMKCPGVGRKIANLIVGEVYNIPAVVVDTHCRRVMKRIGISKSTDPIKVEQDIMKVFPEDSWICLGHMAVMLGRTFCDARRPLCESCPLNEFCGKNM